MNRQELETAVSRISDIDEADELYDFLSDNNWTESIDDYFYYKDSVADFVVERINSQLSDRYITTLSELRDIVGDAEDLIDSDTWFVSDDYGKFGFGSATDNLDWIKDYVINYLEEYELDEDEDEGKEHSANINATKNNGNLNIFTNKKESCAKDFESFIFTNEDGLYIDDF